MSVVVAAAAAAACSCAMRKRTQQYLRRTYHSTPALVDPQHTLVSPHPMPTVPPTMTAHQHHLLLLLTISAGTTAHTVCIVQYLQSAEPASAGAQAFILAADSGWHEGSGRSLAISVPCWLQLLGCQKWDSGPGTLCRHSPP